MDLNDTVDHIAFARVYSLHVDGDRPRLNSELPMPRHERRHLRGMNDVLAGETCNVRTGPANILPLDDGRSLTFLGHRPGHQFAGRAATQYDHVVLFCCLHTIYLLSAAFRGDELVAESCGLLGILFPEVATGVLTARASPQPLQESGQPPDPAPYTSDCDQRCAPASSRPSSAP